ncbi:MAG: tetratricopeptide repeat protein [Lachnospiraceae bacterium]|nr:tetratricopeptide repeat protein [Lachnospiraceae bacterium]
MRIHNGIRSGICICSLLVVLTLGGCGLGGGEDNLGNAYTHMNLAEYDQALEALDMAEAAGEDKAEVFRVRGIAKIYSGDYDGAITDLYSALSYSGTIVDSKDIDINYYIADAFERKGDISSAIDIYTAILDMRDKDTLSYYKRGADYLELDIHDAAVSDFETCLKLEPENYDLRIRIAGTLSDKGYEDEGTALLQQFLEEKERRLSDFDKGRIYFYMKDYENAKLYFEEARDDEEEKIIYLGKTYELLGDYNYAASTYQNYISKHQDSAAVYNQLGLCKISSGDYAGALQAFEQGLTVDSGDCARTLEFNRIVALEYSGDFDRAAKLTNDYINKYPTDDKLAKEKEFLASR